MKIVKTIKIPVIMIFIIITGIGMGTISRGEQPVKLSKPKFRSAGTYLVPKGKKFCETLNSNTKDSLIYYTLDKNKAPASEGLLYTKPIHINGSITIKAVNTKEGFLNSATIERHYIYTSVSPPLPYRGIKVEKMKNGAKKVKGTLSFNSKVTTYIKLTVKKSKGKTKKYNVKVKKGKWRVTLNTPLRKKDTVIISAYTKDYIVCFTKEKHPKLKNTMRVTIESVPNRTWLPVKRVIK